MLGLKRGRVALADAQAEWPQIAAETIRDLWDIFGNTARDIQHIGSTAIQAIKAKPILDIAVGVESLSSLESILPRLEKRGYRRSHNRFCEDLLYVRQDAQDIRTHQIHILIYGCLQWRNDIDFRDYMNAFPEKARAYEHLKTTLAEKCHDNQAIYTDGKNPYMTKVLPDARIWAEMKRRMDVASFDPIEKGWSCDRKYRIAASGGAKYLLRVTPPEKSASREKMFRMMRRVAQLGIPMCQPVEYGVLEEGAYSLQSWIEGVDAEAVLPGMSETRQYAYGLDAGKILKRIHSIPAPDSQEDWALRFNRKIDRNIQMYLQCAQKYENGQAFLDEVQANRHLLKNRPQTFQHGDYHIGNMMIDTDGNLQIIDFDRYDFGDPWEEFNRIVWCAQASPLFASGMVNGYFDGNVPMEFWRLLALYIASNTLSSLPWAISFGQREIDTMRNQAREVLSWYDGMKNPVPAWYVPAFRFPLPASYPAR